MLKLNAVGVNVRHPEDFSIQRPRGSGDWLFLLFESRAAVTLGGQEAEAEPGCAVLFRKGSPQSYRSLPGGYSNSYLHFDRTGTDNSAEHGLPAPDTLLRPGDPEGIGELLALIRREELSASPRREELLDLLMRALLLKLAAAPEAPPQPHSAALRALRTELYDQPGRWRTVEQLAARASLSQPHLQKLWRELFSVSCYEDMLDARTRAARYYLLHTDLSVKAIAAQCGYENDVCFMRRFKLRTGLTPSELRRTEGGRSRAE